MALFINKSLCSKSMTQPVYKQIIGLIRKAADVAKTLGIQNILQPGLVKEMIIADILGHEIIHSKRDADARSCENPNEKYEYLSCKEGGSGQLDRMFKSPEEKRNESLWRITRNTKIFLAIFYKSDQMRCKTIYELSIETVVAETERQLDRSVNAISHVSFDEVWAKKNGIVVYEDRKTRE